MRLIAPGCEHWAGSRKSASTMGWRERFRGSWSMGAVAPKQMGRSPGTSRSSTASAWANSGRRLGSQNREFGDDRLVVCALAVALADRHTDDLSAVKDVVEPDLGQFAHLRPGCGVPAPTLF